MPNIPFKKLAPYLPFGLKINCEKWDDALDKVYPNRIMTIGEDFADKCSIGCVLSIDKLKPILHPLSDLTKEIEHNGERFVPMSKSGRTWLNSGIPNMENEPYWFIKKLLEWHFDVHDLIKDGLAIDINTLTTKQK